MFFNIRNINMIIGNLIVERLIYILLILLTSLLSGLYFGLDFITILYKKNNMISDKDTYKKFTKLICVIHLLILIVTYYYGLLIITLISFIMGIIGGFLGKAIYEIISHKVDKENWKKVSLKKI